MKAHTACACIVGMLTSTSRGHDAIVYKVVEWNGMSYEVDPSEHVGLARSNLNYDNHRPTVFGGTVVIRGSTAVGYDEVGDDLNLVGEIRVFDSMGLSVSNRSLVSGFGVGQFTVRARSRTTRDVVGSASFAFELGMPPNTAAIFTLPTGLFSNSGIQLTPEVWITLQWDFIQGATSASDIHAIYGSPQVLGSSSSMIRNFTTASDIDLGGSPPSSFLWYVRSTPVPSPGVMGTCCITALLLTRRRR